MTSLPLSSLSSSSLVSALFFLFFLPHLSSLLTLTTWESQVLLQLDGWREPLGFCDEVIDKRGYVEAIPTISEILVLVREHTAWPTLAPAQHPPSLCTSICAASLKFTGSMWGRGPATEMYCLYLDDPSGKPSSIVASIARPAIRLIHSTSYPYCLACSMPKIGSCHAKEEEGRREMNERDNEVIFSSLCWVVSQRWRNRIYLVGHDGKIIKVTGKGDIWECAIEESGE